MLGQLRLSVVLTATFHEVYLGMNKVYLGERGKLEIKANEVYFGEKVSHRCSDQGQLKLLFLRVWFECLSLDVCKTLTFDI